MPLTIPPSVQCVVLDSDRLDSVLQSDLKPVRDRGVRIARLCKCDRESAPRRDNFSLLLANADDPVENLRSVSRALRIGLDKMLFLSADPFARAFVSGLLPEVSVPAAPRDTFADADAFLKSLDMRMTVARFDESHLSQIAWLFESSAEFHLTARAYTEEEYRTLLNDPGVLPLYATLRDRLGDYGVVAAVLLEPGDEEMVIRDWTMSGGALWRGVEQHLMNRVVEEAQSRGCTRVSGEYIQNGKNGLVSEFYAQFGFTMIGDEPGHTLWVLPVSAYDPMPAFIGAA